MNTILLKEKKSKYARTLLFINYIVIDRFKYKTYTYVNKYESRSVEACRYRFCGIRAQVESFLQTTYTRCLTALVLSLVGKLYHLFFFLNKKQTN